MFAWFFFGRGSACAHEVQIRWLRFHWLWLVASEGQHHFWQRHHYWHLTASLCRPGFRTATAKAGYFRMVHGLALWLGASAVGVAIFQYAMILMEAYQTMIWICHTCTQLHLAYLAAGNSQFPTRVVSGNAVGSMLSTPKLQDDVAEADKFLQKWKALSDVEKAKKKEEDATWQYECSRIQQC